MKFSKYQNIKALRNLKSNKWKLLSFDDVLLNDTSTASKIKKKDYLDSGIYPIIDQGKEFIAGYTDSEDGIYKSTPSIIFGDHTRIIKFVNFPIFIGADGVKLLKNKYPEDEILTKYLYYYLLTVNIPNTGYNRHFKYLKEVVFPIPSIKVQKSIVKMLDKVRELIDKRYEQINALNYLTQGIFHEMFGNPITNIKKWDITTCGNIATKIGSGATPRGGKASYKDKGISLIRSMNVYNNKFNYKDLAFIDEEQAEKLNNVEVQKNDVLLNITGASVARCCVVPENTLPARVNQHVSIIRVKKHIANPYYLNYLLTDPIYQKYLLQIATSGGATREAITKQQIENLPIILPPLKLQNEFVSSIEKIEKQKISMQSSKVELQNLFNALLLNAFNGEMFSSDKVSNI